jgi:hypothetical protein
MRLFGVLTVLTVVPLMQAIGSVKSPYMAYVLIVLALAIVSLYTSISGVVKAEMFPPEVRALSVGSAYAIANAGLAAQPNMSRCGSRSTGLNGFLLVRDDHVRHCTDCSDHDARPQG